MRVYKATVMIIQRLGEINLDSETFYLNTVGLFDLTSHSMKRRLKSTSAARVNLVVINVQECQFTDNYLREFERNGFNSFKNKKCITVINKILAITK